MLQQGPGPAHRGGGLDRTVGGAGALKVPAPGAVDATLFACPVAAPVAIGGPDAIAFLQSLLSQDVESVAPGYSAPALLLDPRGRLEVATRFWRRGPDEAWLVCDPGDAGRLAARLEGYRIRVDVRIDDRSATWGAIAVRGRSAPGLRPVAEAAVAGSGGGTTAHGWPGVPGFDVVAPLAGLAGAAAALEERAVEVGDDTGYEELRIRCGVPRSGAELDRSTFPQEAFLDVDAVSFDKGCFVGQEVVGRIHARGHVNRYLRHLRPAEPHVRLAPGAEVVVGATAVGAVTSSTTGLALGYVRREVEPPAGAAVAGRPVVIEALPAR
ncbi:MAG: folate-binding protein YgfZ [Acidimicrobiia bacterium]|nr:folate-binding protein YgfZ [Acidimicrobiia bacterium]